MDCWNRINRDLFRYDLHRCSNNIHDTCSMLRMDKYLLQHWQRMCCFIGIMQLLHYSCRMHRNDWKWWCMYCKYRKWSNSMQAICMHRCPNYSIIKYSMLFFPLRMCYHREGLCKCFISLFYIHLDTWMHRIIGKRRCLYKRFNNRSIEL